MLVRHQCQRHAAGRVLQRYLPADGWAKPGFPVISYGCLCLGLHVSSPCGSDNFNWGRGRTTGPDTELAERIYEMQVAPRVNPKCDLHIYSAIYTLQAVCNHLKPFG